MIRLVLHLLVLLMAAERWKPKNKDRWTPEASNYLMHMEVEWQIIYLEHCLDLDCSKHYQIKDY